MTSSDGTSEAGPFCVPSGGTASVFLVFCPAQVSADVCSPAQLGQKQQGDPQHWREFVHGEVPDGPVAST